MHQADNELRLLGTPDFTILQAFTFGQLVKKLDADIGILNRMTIDSKARQSNCKLVSIDEFTKTATLFCTDPLCIDSVTRVL